MIDLSTYDVFWINDVHHGSTFTISYENLCRKVESLSRRLTPCFTIKAYRWDRSPRHERGSLVDGVVVLGTDHFKIFHELNTETQIDFPCSQCNLRIKCRNGDTSCHDKCLIWQNNWRYAEL